MKPSRLELFAGKPIKLANGHQLYSPTYNEIIEIGEVQYSINLIFALFEKERIMLDLYEMDNETIQSINDVDDYEVLITFPSTKLQLCHAYSFFTKSKVDFNPITEEFEIDGVSFLTRENYREIISLIRIITSNNNEEKPAPFKNEKAKKLFEKMTGLRKKNSKGSNDGLEIKDVLSILCNSEGNGINIFNVFSLTVYQVFEQFEMLNAKENHRRLLPVWANGNLKEDTVLPEWIKKTKL